MTFRPQKSDNVAHGRRLLGCARYSTHPILDNSGLPQKFHRAVAKKFRCRSGTNPALADHPFRITDDRNQGEHQNHVQDQRNNQRGLHPFPLSARCRALAGGPPEQQQACGDENHLDHEAPVRTYLHARSPLGRAWHFGFAPATQALVEVVRLCGGVSWRGNHRGGNSQRRVQNGEQLFPTVHQKPGSALPRRRFGRARQPLTLHRAAMSQSAPRNSGYQASACPRTKFSWSCLPRSADANDRVRPMIRFGLALYLAINAFVAWRLLRRGAHIPDIREVRRRSV